jgi:peptide/nickel transport system substrate-binding protein
MTPDVLHGLPGYGADVKTNRAEARSIMQRLGYGPEKRLGVTISTRYVEGYRDAAVIAISQLKETYIDGQLEVIETANWFPRVMRKDYTVGVTVSEGGLDEPDQKFYETYVCGAERRISVRCT